MRLIDKDSPEPEAPRKLAGRRARKRQAGATTLAELLEQAGLTAEDLSPKALAAMDALIDERARLDEDLSKAKARVSALEKLAHEDAMMPVANRRAFIRELSRLLSLAQRHGIHSTIIYMDVNGLKAVNDRLGHNAGDAMLRRVAQILIEQVRQSDVVARLGGDEFAVLLVKSGAEAAEQKAQQLNNALGDTAFYWEGQRLPLSVAWGIHVLSGDENAEEALHRADQAMYRSKRLHKAATVA